jgi:hypothetical protein
MKRVLVLICIFGALIAACDPSTRESETVVEGMAFEGYEVTPFSLYKTTGECDSDSSRTCTSVNIEFPVFADSLFAEAATRINSDVTYQAANYSNTDSTSFDTIEAMANDFIEEYTDLQKDFPEAFGWQLNINGEVLRNDGLYVVVKMESNSYTGGAHGNTNTQFSNYYAVSGNKITLDDIFEPGYKSRLNNLALDAFRKQRGMLAGEDPAAMGFTFEDNRYYNPDNFALMEEEIIFYFNHYQIAPYSEGPTEIRVPLASIAQ